jgi:diguanylate cyclase (GGDEF)-like protein/PAS domain S-box-containing protein
MRPTFPLRSKTTLGLLAMLVLLLAALLWRQHNLEWAAAEQHQRAQVTAAADLVAAALRQSVVAGDAAEVERLARTLTDGRWLVYVRVYGRDQMFVETGTPPIAGGAAAAAPVADALIADGDYAYGRVEVGLTPLVEAHVSRWFGFDTFDIMLLLVAAGMGVAFALLGLLFRDLRRLKDGARHIATGEYGYQLPVEGNDALAQAVAAFNAMSRSLQQAHSLDVERERALRLSEMRLAEAQRIASLGHWEWNYATDRIYWSDEIYRIFGLPPQVSGASYEEFLSFMHEGDRAEVREAIDAALTRQRPFNLLHRIVRRDGEERWVRQRGEVFRSADGSPLRMVGTMQDVTEARHATEELRSQQYWLETLLDAMPDFVCFKDGAGRWLVANRFGLQMFGLETVDYRGKTDSELAQHSRFYRDALEACADSDGAVWQSGESQWSEEVIPRPDGPSLLFEITKVPLYNPDGGRKGLVVVGRDATERRRAEAALQEKSRQIISLLESTTDAYFAVDRHWHVTYFNAEAERLLEVTRQQALGQELWDVAPELASSFYKRFAQALKQQQHQQFEGYYPPLQKYFETHLYPSEDGLWVFFRDVTERHENEAALRENSARSQAVLENILDGIVTIDGSGLITGFNHAAEQIFGYRAADILGRSVTLLMPEPYRSQHEAFVRRYLSTRDNAQALGRSREMIGVRNDGSAFPLEISLSEATQHEQPLFIAVLRDLTERRTADENMRLAAKVFDNSVEGILVTDAAGRIMRVNRAFSAITGYGEEEILGKTPAVLKSGRHDEDFYQAMWGRLRAEGKWQGEIWNRRKNGEVYPEWLSINQLPDASGQVSHYVAIFSDITEKKEAEQRIYHLAYYDPLTELPNRTMFHGRLLQAMAEAKRNRRMVALLYIDLDRFKNINDTLGHFIGDELLKEAARRLLDSVRECDTVARLGGDEFVIMLTDLHHETEIAHIAQQVLAAMGVPFQLQGHEVFVTTSAGISVYPLDADTLEDMIKYADTAMYHAKEAGRNNYQFYRSEMNASAFERLVMENSLRRALERGEFELYYQPQNSLSDGRIVGVEALLRWHHPDLGTVMPSQFIPVLEETGMILPVGEWVLRSACRQIAAWQAAGYGPLRVAVNLSPRQFCQSGLLESVRAALQDNVADPTWLELEITEGSLMGNAEAGVATLRQLKELGVWLSVDDFGTGYSSLSYLKRFPIDTLKIDQSFVRDVTSDPDDAAIAGTIIAMGHSLNLHVLAEGVEAEDQLQFLRAHGCDQVQGYLFSQPQPAQRIEQMLGEGRRLALGHMPEPGA